MTFHFIYHNNTIDKTCEYFSWYIGCFNFRQGEHIISALENLSDWNHLSYFTVIKIILKIFSYTYDRSTKQNTSDTLNKIKFSSFFCTYGTFLRKQSQFDFVYVNFVIHVTYQSISTLICRQAKCVCVCNPNKQQKKRTLTYLSFI